MKKNSIPGTVLSIIAAAFVMSSCVKEDHIPETMESDETSAVITIPYTVTVNREPDTRATVDSDWKTLRFAEGDKLYISGVNVLSSGILKGVLDIQTGVGETSGATFSGNLTYTGDESTLSDPIWTFATLVSAQQTVGKEVSVDEDGVVSVNYPNDEYCATVEEAVQRYSSLRGFSTYQNKSFTLSQSTTFLNFEMTFEDGTPAGTELSASVTTNQDNGPVCTANVTTRDEGGKVVAKFVLPKAASYSLNYAKVKLGTRDGISFGTNGKELSGKVYNVKKTVEFPGPLTEVPLTIRALTDGTVKVNIEDDALYTGMKYSVKGGAKTLITTSTDIPLSAGDWVQFYGNGTATQSYGRYPEVSIQGDGAGFTCKAYGNIMSLLDEEGFATMSDLPNENYIFSGLFKENTALTDADGLRLPATSLVGRCYSNMFEGCTALTAAPALPATTLALRCYESMFEGCTALTVAPALPATSLADWCYSRMFVGCTALTSVFELPATTLAEWCYSYMFEGCTALASAPALPAPNPVEKCYHYMFSGCSNLGYVKCLATSGINSDNFFHWLYGVTATGTFHLANRTGLIWPEGENGIPSGWTGKYPDGSTWIRPYPLSSVTSGDIGRPVGPDGKIYTKEVVANEGITPVAMVAYVGTESSCSHGLAITLFDESETKNWSDARTLCAGKTAVPGGTWRLPSERDWQFMCIGCGSDQQYVDPYSADDIEYGPLEGRIKNASGSAFTNAYWTSTDYEDTKAYYMHFFVYGALLTGSKSNLFSVRACLAF